MTRDDMELSLVERGYTIVGITNAKTTHLRKQSIFYRTINIYVGDHFIESDSWQHAYEYSELDKYDIELDDYIMGKKHGLY